MDKTITAHGKSQTFAAVPPISTDLMKIPRSFRLAVSFLTLMPRLANPASPRAMWKVSLSCSSSTVFLLVVALVSQTDPFALESAFTVKDVLASVTGRLLPLEELTGDLTFGKTWHETFSCWAWNINKHSYLKGKYEEIKFKQSIF
jgi:hypothetical protein